MIIGIGGEKKHGKDTVANYLVKNYQYTQRAFADNLKELCSHIFDVPLVDMYNETKKEVIFKDSIRITEQHINHLFLKIEKEYNPSLDQRSNIFIKLTNKRFFFSIRDMLQFVGTDILRDEVDENYHYNTAVRYFKEYKIINGVVSDVRFPNERNNLKIDFPQSITVLVKRPSLQKDNTSSHASETSLGNAEDYDYVVINDGTLEDLYKSIDSIMVKEFTLIKGK